jgi:hypothetical protein
MPSTSSSETSGISLKRKRSTDTDAKEARRKLLDLLRQDKGFETICEPTWARLLEENGVGSLHFPHLLEQILMLQAAYLQALH